MKDWQKYFAEALGTMILVLLGCGTAIFASALDGGAAWLVATALAFGLALTAVAYTIGTVSGAHINPAVSLAMAMKRKISWKDFAFYVIAQVIGALIGAAVLFLLLKIMDVPTEGNMGANSYSGTAVLSELAAGQQIVVALITEILLTFIFVLTILGVTRKADNKAAAGLIIGLTLTVIHLASISVTGTSVNPARSIGPALFGGLDALKEVWLFIVAPLIGGMLAALTAYCLFDGEEGENNVKDAVIDSKSKSASTKT